jgi:hypothetical protein
LLHFVSGIPPFICHFENMWVSASTPLKENILFSSLFRPQCILVYGSDSPMVFLNILFRKNSYGSDRP